LVEARRQSIHRQPPTVRFQSAQLLQAAQFGWPGFLAAAHWWLPTAIRSLQPREPWTGSHWSDWM